MAGEHGGESLETQLAELRWRMTAIEADRETASNDRRRIEGLAKATFDKLTALENQAKGGRKVLGILFAAATVGGPAVAWLGAKMWPLMFKP